MLPIYKPAVIYLIRHGEKPDESQGRDEHLSPAGFTRGAALCEQYERLFLEHGELDQIYACGPSRESVRPIETVTNLATHLGLEIHSKFKDAEYKELAKSLFKKKHDGEVILICWHHGMLPELIEVLGGNSNVAPIESRKWPEATFDKVIKIFYMNDGVLTSSFNQSLLYGDD